MYDSFENSLQFWQKEVAETLYQYNVETGEFEFNSLMGWFQIRS
jgi:hypothetical protein